MSEPIPKWAYVLVGALLVVLIIVAIVGLVSTSGTLIVSILVICGSVLGLFFGYQHYKKQHTLAGKVGAFGEELLGSLGFGRKSWFDKLTGKGRGKK